MTKTVKTIRSNVTGMVMFRANNYSMTKEKDGLWHLRKQSLNLLFELYEDVHGRQTTAKTQKEAKELLKAWAY